MWLRDFGVLSERRHKIPWVSYHTFCCSVRFKERFTLRFKTRFNLSPTADWDSRKVSRRFQKVPERIQPENQNPQRPFVYYTGRPPRPRCVLCERTRLCPRPHVRLSLPYPARPPRHVRMICPHVRAPCPAWHIRAVSDMRRPCARYALHDTPINASIPNGLHYRTCAMFVERV